MIHQTYVTAVDQRSGDVYLRFGTVDRRDLPSGKSGVAVGLELTEELLLTPLRVNLIMSGAEAIRLSDELRRLASDITK